MSFIVKNILNISIPEITTSTTTTPAATTPAPAQTFQISDSLVWAGAFGGVGVNGYSIDIPLFDEFSKLTPGSVGSVNIEIITNNSNYTKIGDEYFVDLNIVARFTNTSNTKVFLKVPRIAIDIGFENGGKSLLNSFEPNNSSKNVGLYTIDRLVAEFDDTQIVANGFIEREVINTLTVVTTGINPPNIDISNVSINSISRDITNRIASNNTGSNLYINTINIRNTDVGIIPISISNNDILAEYVYTPNGVGGFINDYPFGSLILLNDSPTPNWLVATGNRKGYLDGNTSIAPTTTTPPIPVYSASMSFVFPPSFPNTNPQPLSTTNSDTHDSGTEVQIYIKTDTTNFGGVPYKLILKSATSGILLSNTIGNTPPVALTFFADGDVIDQGSLDINVGYGTSGIGVSGLMILLAPINTNVAGDIIFELFIDKVNDGNYVFEDSIKYNIGVNSSKNIITSSTTSGNGFIPVDPI